MTIAPASETTSDSATTDDPVIRALDELVAALADTSAVEHALERADTVRQRRMEGASYRDLTTDEQRPLLVELISDHLSRLAEAGARFRRAEAAALHQEGATMEEIARAFGVSRQRVSAILREARAKGLT